VLVATDGSQVSLRAAEYAARLAHGLRAKLFALYVVDEHLAFHGGVHYAEFVEMLSQEGREATGKVRALAEEAGVDFEELIVLGKPEQTILSVAKEVGADPIVLGSEGKSGMEHALIGSVSEEVLRHASRTVLVVGGHPEGGNAKSGGPADRKRRDEAVNTMPGPEVTERGRIRPRPLRRRSATPLPRTRALRGRASKNWTSPPTRAWTPPKRESAWRKRDPTSWRGTRGAES
jgi:nucleotide-binding universal stress UspA family protein